jgi:hypothetical protein
MMREVVTESVVDALLQNTHRVSPVVDALLQTSAGVGVAVEAMIMAGHGMAAVMDAMVAVRTIGGSVSLDSLLALSGRSIMGVDALVWAQGYVVGFVDTVDSPTPCYTVDAPRGVRTVDY